MREKRIVFVKGLGCAIIRCTRFVRSQDKNMQGLSSLQIYKCLVGLVKNIYNTILFAKIYLFLTLILTLIQTQCVFTFSKQISPIVHHKKSILEKKKTKI